MEVSHHVLQIKFEFRYAPSIFSEKTDLGLGKFWWSNSFPDFFPKCLQILTWFLAWKSITMFYRLNLTFVTLHRFLVKARTLDLVNFSDQFSGLFFYMLADIDLSFGMEVSHHVLQIEFEFCYAPSIFGEIMDLGLSKFQWSNSFPDFPSIRLQILTWFLACKSVTLTYRSSLIFVMLHRFLRNHRPWDLVNFSDQTVPCTFCPKPLHILSWFLACKSIIMTYRSNWSFVAPHWFFAELRA